MNQYSKLPVLGTSFFYNVLVHAVKVTIENAETQYSTHMIVRCYNRMQILDSMYVRNKRYVTRIHNWIYFFAQTVSKVQNEEKVHTKPCNNSCTYQIGNVLKQFERI